MKKKMYFLLLLKRALKKYPSILAITLITLFGIVAAATLLLRNDKESEDCQKVSVGVVGNTADTFFDVGIDVIKNIDESRYYIDIITMSKEQAEKALDDNSIIGYIDVPESFIDGIAAMDNIPAVYYLPNKPESLGTALTKEVIDTVAVYITESQKVVAGLRSYIRANNLIQGKSLDEISVRLMTRVILPRNQLYETEYTGISDSVSTGGYYVAGLMLFFMLLWSLACSGILIKTDYSMPKQLRSKGFGSTKQILCEYSVYITVTLATLLVLSVFFGLAITGFDTGIKELAAKGVSDCILYIVKILPVILAICAMQYFLYELISGKAASILLQFLSAILLGYISGCFYPDYFFPEAVRKTAGLLPTGAGFTYMRQALVSGSAVPQLVILIAYTAVFLAASGLVRRKRLESDEE